FTYLGTAVGLLVTLHLIGFGLYSRPLIQPTVTALKVGIIQGNIPNEIKLISEGGRRALYVYTNGYQALADQGVDAVLTPEASFRRAIAGICYYTDFSDHFRRQAAVRGQFILSAANEPHYSEATPAQHHAQDVMRAIDTARCAVRATNTGYSAIIDPHGRTI